MIQLTVTREEEMSVLSVFASLPSHLFLSIMGLIILILQVALWELVLYID
jgi:hypothetical protein